MSNWYCNPTYRCITFFVMDNLLPDPIPTKIIKPKKIYDKKVHGKRYSNASKITIKAMKELNDIGVMSVSAIAEQAGTTSKQVYRVWNDPELDDLSPEVVARTKKGLTGLFYKRAMQASMAISASKLDQASALQLATVAGIMTEKGRLMEGLSTENVSHRGLNDTLDADRKRLMDKMNSIGAESV